MIIYQSHIILYVKDQAKSTHFYENILKIKPRLYVPGMTEFQLSENFVLGLMPTAGIATILQSKMPHPDLGIGIPRCELYFYVNTIDTHFQRAIACGATLISPITDRNWGDRVGYLSDMDGHIIALAEKIV